jgi:NAD(P) transhydrogenase
MTGERDFELLVIGSGPAGQRAAIQAAKLARRVACVERRHMLGGVCVNTGRSLRRRFARPSST